MNRRERRAQQSRTAKLARNASPEEILPGGHGPVQSGLVDLMTATVDVLRESIGLNYDVTLFVAERTPADGSTRLPRFNYMSTAERADMLAVLKAFTDRNGSLGPTLDKIEDEPPTRTAQ
jgi:hypothetical protein